MKFLKLLSLFFLFGQCLARTAYSQTIEEKIIAAESPSFDLDSETMIYVEDVNKRLKERRELLAYLYWQITILHEAQASCDSFRELVCQINTIRNSISAIEEEWRMKSMEICPEGSFSLWHQPDTTLEQLVIDYGSQEYVYLIPPEVSKMKVSVDSHLPIPKESWSEMVELILANSGLGVKQLNPFLRQVYLLDQEPLGLTAIISKRDELSLFPDYTRVCFAMVTKSQDPSGIFHFLNRFTHNSERVKIHLIGRAFFIIAQVQEIKELLALYDFVEQSEDHKEYKLVSLRRTQADEIGQILQAYFYHAEDKNAVTTSSYNGSDLKVVPLKTTAQALFLIGSREQICKAERIICDIEERLEDPKEKTIYWYTCKHAQANDVAIILERIYLLMTNSPWCLPEPAVAPEQSVVVVSENNTSPCGPYGACGPCGPVGPYGPCGPPSIDDPPPVVYPDPVIPPPFCAPALGPGPCSNFIVDEKSGAIIMVIESDYLPKMKEIVKKLDQPAKMVQIEVLLFEKKIHDQNNFGLNLLKIGSQASNTRQTSVLWNDVASGPGNQGILSFFLSRMRGGGLPAYDLVYNFMLSQDDVQINACPSITTVNQTCAKIALVEEISINTGVVQFDCYNNCVLKDAYTRAQYGITIEITPTVHFPDICELDPCEDPRRYITLDTNIVFDTAKPSPVNRPDVTRRNITNQIRVPDGQTVILGGLRRKMSHDYAEKIPFLGEIPGIGKFFSITRLTDTQTEMFIFITPKIIADPVYDFYRLRCEELRKRPGDLPVFMRCLCEAQELERDRAFSGGMEMLFGNLPECGIGAWPACTNSFEGY